MFVSSVHIYNINKFVERFKRFRRNMPCTCNHYAYPDSRARARARIFSLLVMLAACTAFHCPNSDKDDSGAIKIWSDHVAHQSHRFAARSSRS